METKQVSVQYMTDYLRFAIDLERYSYIWQKAFSDCNQKLRVVYNERRQLENTQRSAQNTIAAIAPEYGARRRYVSALVALSGKGVSQEDKQTLLGVAIAVIIFVLIILFRIISLRKREREWKKEKEWRL